MIERSSGRHRLPDVRRAGACRHPRLPLPRLRRSPAATSSAARSSRSSTSRSTSSRRCPMTAASSTCARASWRRTTCWPTALRARFAVSGVHVSNWVSSPGTRQDRTARGAARARRSSAGSRRAALVGDCATDNDAVAARPLRGPGPADRHREHVPPRVGHDLGAPRGLGPRRHSTCSSSRTSATSSAPPAYDLGEDTRVALLSVTEGEDKPAEVPAAVPLRRRHRHHQDRHRRRPWNGTASRRWPRSAQSTPTRTDPRDVRAHRRGRRRPARPAPRLRATLRPNPPQLQEAP